MSSQVASVSAAEIMLRQIHVLRLAAAAAAISKSVFDIVLLNTDCGSIG